MKIFVRFLAFLPFFFFAGEVLSQSCSGFPAGNVNPGNFLTTDPVCAPVTANWEITYGKVTDGGVPANVSFEVEWGDGVTITYPYVAGDYNPAIINEVHQTVPGSHIYKAMLVHTYPPAGNVCSYEPRVYLNVNGERCLSSYQTQLVSSWNVEDQGTGVMLLDEQGTGLVVVPVCEGEPYSGKFQDNSTFNCNPTDFPDNPNVPDRYIQFVYGTFNNGTYALRDRIPQISVGGVPVTDAAGNLIGGVPLYSTPQNIPLVATASGLLTNLINMPAGVSTNGQVFEVTVRNWNYCNPYDDPDIFGPPVDLVNGDHPPVITTALIEIITTPPDLTGVTSDFCIGDILSVTIDPYLTGGFINWYANLVDVGDPTKIIYTGSAFNASTTPPVAYRLPNTAAGSRTYYVTEQLGNCESDPSPIAFTVRNALTTTGPVSCSKATNLCPGETGITFSVPNNPPTQVFGGTTEYVWTVPVGWTITGGQGTKTITVTVGTTTGSQTVSVYLQYATDPRCPATDINGTKTINSLPGATIGPATLSYCSNQSGTNPDIDITGLTGQTPFTIVYEWNAGANTKTLNNISANVDNDNPLPWPGTGTTTTYSLKSITDASGCVSTVPSAKLLGSCVVRVRETLTAPPVLTGPTSVCSGEQDVIYTLPDVAPNNPIGGLTRYRYQETNTGNTDTDWFNWNDGTVGFTDYETDDDQQIDVKTTGLQISRRLRVRLEYQTTVTSGSRCETGYSNKDVTVYPLPDAVISGTTTICNGGSATLTFTVTNGPVNIEYTDGTSTFNLNNVNSTTASTGVLTANTTYSISSVVRASAPACGGTKGGSAIITVNQLPTAGTDDLDETICQGENFSFDVDLTGVVGGNFILGYKINAGATIYTPEFDDYTHNLTILSASLTPGAVNTITLVSITQNVGVASACSGTIVVGQESIDVTVSRTPSDAAAGGDQLLCASLASNPFNASAPSGAWEFGTWEKVSGPGTVTFLPNASTRTATANILAGQEGVYEFQWIIQSGVCPVTRDTLEVDFGVSPTVDAGGPYDHCMPSLPALAATNSTGTGTWSKQAGPGNLTFTDADENDAEVTADLDGIYTIRWTVISGACAPVHDDASLTFWPLPVVADQPDDDAICAGDNSSFSILPNNAINYTYQWQKDEGTGFFNISDGVVYSGSNTANLSITNAGIGMSGFEYRCILIENAHSCPQFSDAATLTVHPYPVVTDQPDNKSICDGGDTFFAIAHDASTPTYQWQISTNGGGLWTNLANGAPYSGVGSDTLRLVNVPSTFDTYQYRCIVTEAGLCPTTSTAATITVHEYPVVTDDPDNDEICENDNTSFTMDATGGVLSFQWQIFNGLSYDDLTAVAPYSNVDQKTLSISNAPASLNGKKYRCKITESGLCSSFTADATLTVHEYPTVDVHPSNDETCKNGNAGFSVTATGVSLSYKWQVDDGGGFVDIADGGIYSGSGTSALNITGVSSAEDGYEYRCRITESNLCSANSNQATLTVHDYPVINDQPDDSEICNAQNTSFTIAATTTVPSYQWQVDDGGGFVDLTDGGIYTNTNGTSLVLTAATVAYNGYKYRCIVTESGLCDKISEEATLTVHPFPGISTQPVDDETCTSSNAMFFVEATGPNLTYQWEYHNGGGWANVPVDGIHSQVTNDTLLLSGGTDAMNGYLYRCRVTESALCVLTSNQAELIVYQFPAITQAADAETCNGGNASYIIAAPGATFQWQIKNGAVWDNLSNASVYSGVTTNTLNLTGVDLTYNNAQYRCMVTQSGLCQTPTNPYLLTVHKLPSISDHPGNPAVCDGADATLSISPNNAAEYTYQWQVNKNDGFGFVNTPDNATYDNVLTASLQINNATLGMNGFQYRCRIDSTDTGCSGMSNPGTLTVHPIPVVDEPADIFKCADVLTTFPAFETDQDPVDQFRWFNNNIGVYTIGISGIGNLPSFTTPANNTTGILTSTIQVVAEKNSCVSDTLDFTINIYPSPAITQLDDSAFCPGLLINMPDFTSSLAGTTFYWTNSNTQIGTLAAGGTNHLPNFTSGANITGAGKTSTITVYDTSAVGCGAAAMQFDLTLKPKPFITAINDTSVCAQQNVLLPAFTANTAAPTSFAWSEAGSIGLAPTTGNTSQVPLFTSSVNNTVNNIEGIFTVTATKDGCASVAEVFSLFIKPTPQMSPIDDITSCPGNVINVPDFSANTGGGEVFNWTNDNPAINLGLTGTGDIANFNAANNTSGSDIVANLQVTATKNSCTSLPESFMVSIWPTPSVIQKDSIIVCPGQAINPGVFTSDPPGSSFTWTNNNVNIGLNASGSDNIDSYNAANITSDSIIANISVIGELSTCPSPAMQFTIVIKPKPVISPITPDVVVCPEEMVVVQPFSAVPSGSVFSWTNSNTANGLVASGNNSIPSYDAPDNTTGAYINGNVTVTANLNGCLSNSDVFLIRIKPTPGTSAITGQFNVCATSDPASPTTKLYRVDPPNGTPGNTYNWSVPVSNPVANEPVFTNYNNSYVGDFSMGTWTGTIQVIETSVEGCIGLPSTAIIRAYEIPVVEAGPDVSICQGETVILGGAPAVTGGSGNYTYSWIPTLGLNDATIANPQASPSSGSNYILQATDASSGCQSLTDNVSVDVNPQPNPPAAASQSVCYGEPVPDLIATGTNIRWYGDSGLTNLLSVDNPFSTGESAVGVYTFYVTQSALGCESEARQVSLTIYAIPAAPASNNEEICQGQPTPDLYATGSNVQWFSDMGLSVLVKSGNLFATNKTLPGVYNYWVTQTVNNCQSPATPVSLTIFAKPLQPISSDKTVCYGLPVPPLVAQGNNIKWYDDIFLITPIAVNDTLITGQTEPGTYIYYVTQEENGCTSPTLQVKLVIRPVPEILLASSTNETVCNSGDGTVKIIASGQSPLTYSIDGGTSFAASGNFSGLGNGNYPVVVKNGYGCLAAGDTLKIFHGDAPFAPPAGTSRTYCDGATLVNLTATAVSGGTLNWYTDAGLTVSLGNSPVFAPFNTIGTTTYYVTETTGGCESQSTNIVITINPIPPAPEINDTAVCTGQTVPTLSASGSNVIWYSDAGLSTAVYAGNFYNTGQTAVNDYTYYLTQTENNCTSPASSVTLTIHQSPTVPDADNEVSCYGFPVPDLEAAGSGVYWFSNSALTQLEYDGNIFPTGNVDPGTYTYYVIQSNLNCRSASRTVTQTIYSIPAKPVAPDKTICFGEPSPLLTSTGSVVRWYTSPPPGVPVYTGNSYNHGIVAPGTYPFYVTQTVNGCESPADTCVFIIHPKPDKPVAPDVTACFGQNIPDLTATGQNLKWYYGITLVGNGSPFASGRTVVGTFIYNVTQTINNCTSEPEEVNLVINPSPTITNVAFMDQSVCNSNDGQISITATGTMPLDYSIDDTATWQNSGAFTGLKNGLYPTSVRNAYGCIVWSDTIAINDGNAPDAPLAERDTVYCSNETIAPIVAYPTGPAQITWFSNFALTDTIAIANSIVPDSYIGTKHYFAVQSVGACESPATQITILINQQPAPPVSGDTALCFGLPVPNLSAEGENIQWFSHPSLTLSLHSGNTYATGKTDPGNYVYYVTQTQNNCRSLPTMDTLTIHALPNLSFTATPDEGCSPLDVQLMNTSDSVDLLWNFGDGTIDSVYTPANHLYLNASGSIKYYSIKLTGTNEHGCVKNLTKPVTVYPLKNFDFIVIPDSACHPASVDIISAPGAEEYDWNFGNGQTYTGPDNNPTRSFSNLSNTTDTTYQITLRITTQAGCIADYSHSVTVHPQPVASFTVNPASGGTPFTPAIANNSSGAATYSWNFGDNTALSLEENPVHTWENPGTIPLNLTVSLTISNAGGCPHTSNQAITVFPIPPPPVCTNKFSCEGQTTPNLVATGQSGAFFRWYDSDLLLTPLQEGDYVFPTGQTDPGEYHYWVTQEKFGVVSLPTEVTLTIYPKPQPPVLTDTAICFGDARPLLIAAGENIKWYKNFTLTTLLVQNDSLYPPDSLPRLNAYLYYATQEENGCTSNYATQRFYIYPLPVIITATAQDQTYCNSGDGRIVINAQNVNFPLFYSMDGGNNFYPSDYSTNQGLKTFSNLGSGNYPIVLQNKFGCNFIGDTLEVSAGGAPPAPDAGDDAVYCYGDAVANLWAESNPAGDTLIWYSDVLLQNQVGFGTSFEPFVYEDTTITYYVRSFKGGCPSPVSAVTVTINGIPNPPVVRDTAICFGQDAPVLFVQGENLQWFADPGLTIAISDQQPEDVGVGIHKYYIRQIVNGCISGASELTFTVYNTPPKPLAANTSACFNNSTDLLTATGTTGTIYWSGNRLFTDTLNIGTDFYTGHFEPGQFTYYLVEEYIENGHVCRSAYDTATQTIRALPPAPNHYFFNDSVICSNEPKPTFMADGSSVSSTYRWFFSATPGSTLGTNKTYKPANSLTTGIYYYSLTQTLDGCTSLPDTLVFTIRQQPQPPVAPDVSACFGQEIPPLTAIGLGIEWTDGGTTLATGNTFNTGETAEGTYFYFVSQTVQECTSVSESVVLTIHNSPEITDVDTTPQSGCNMNDGKIHIHIAPALPTDNIRFSIDNGNNFQASGLFENLRNGLYPTYVVNKYNCFDRGDTVKISDITTVPAPFAERDTVYCSYENREYLVATALPGIDSLVWYRNNFDDTLFIGDQVMPDLIIGETSYYVVQVSEGCESDPTELKVTIKTQPQAPTTADTALCFGLNVPDLTALGFNILWYTDTTSSSIASGNIFDPPAINPGQYIYFATQTMDGCESPAAPDTLIIHPKPVINFSVAPVDSCSPMPVRITNLSIADTCTWLLHDDTIVGYNPPTHTYYNTSNNTRTFQITLQAETQYGCTKSGSKEVHVFPVKDYSFTASPEFICSGQTVQFFSPQGAYPYYWNFGDGTDAIEAGNNVIHTFFNATSTTKVYTVTMQAKTSFGCFTPVYQKVITVYPKPVANFEMDTLAGCTPFTPNINNLSVGASHWIWKLDGVPVSTLENMDSVFENPYNSSLYYNLSLSVSNDDGCVSEPHAQIFSVFPKVNASIGVFGDTSGCGKLPVRFSNMGNGTIWHWEFEQGLPSDNFTPPEHIFTNLSDTISIFHVTLHSVSSFGCSDRDTMQVVVYPIPGVHLDVDKFNFCSPDTVTCTNISDPGLDYIWKFGDGTPDYSTSDQTDFTHPYFNAGQGVSYKNLVLTGTSQYNCSASDSATITVYPNLQAAFTYNLTDSCGTRQVNFTDLSNLTTLMTYSWNFGDGAVSALRNPVHAFENNAHDTIAGFIVRFSATWNNLCTNIFTDTVNVYPVPFASFTSDFYEGCSPLDIQTVNNSLGLADDVFTWSFGDPTPDANTIDVNHTYENQSLSNATANLKLSTVNRYGCRDDSVAVITIFPALSAGFNVSDTAGCHPLKVYFYNQSSGPGALSYNFGDGTPASTQASPVHTFNNPDYYVADTFTVVLQKMNGICTDLFTRKIIVFPTPKAEFSVLPAEGCPPFLAEFNSGNSLGRRDSSRWAFGDLEGSTTDSILVHHLYRNQNNPNPVNYLASFTTYNISGAYACASTFTDTIRVYPEVKAGFLADTGKCSGQNFHFTNTSSGTTQFHWFEENYPWESTFTNPDKIFNNTSQLVDTLNIHLVAILPEYELCNDTISKPIYIYPIPAVSYTLTEDFGCSPFTVECVNTTSMNLNFQWNFGTGFISQTNDTMNFVYNIGATQPSEKIIQLKGTSNYGCVGSIQQQVTVYPEVTAQFTQDKTQGCSPLEIRFTNESTGFDSIAWNFDNGFTSQSQYPIELFLNASSTDSALYHVQLIAKTDWCADTATVAIEVHPAPKAMFWVAPFENCSPVTIHISDSSQGISQYYWEFGDQQTSSDPGPEIEHTYPGPLLPTSYNLRLTGENDFGCQSSQNMPVYVKPSVEASFIPTDTVGCSPLLVTFQNYSTGNNLTYSWRINNGVAITESSPTRSFVNNGFSDSTLFVELVARSQYNCFDTASRFIRVFATPNANFTLIPETMLYPQTTAYLLQQTPDSDTITWNYSWNFGDNSSSNLREPQQHVYDTSGMFRVFLRVDGMHCWDSMSRILTITLPPPIAEFDSIPAGCAPHVVQFSNRSIYAHTYRWTFGDGSVSNSRQPEHTYWDAGLYQVKLNIIGPGGTDEQSRYILVHPKPFARFDVAPEFIYVPEQPVKCFNQSENGDLFEWDFGDGSAVQTDTTPVHYYQQAGEYNIKMVVKTDTDPQCVDSVIREKAVLAENAGVINLPNAFRPSASGPNGGYYTPNGYNNHIFYPPVANSVIEYKLTIFNRWGQKIFETSDINQGWDGYFDGKQCSQDVYVWKVEGKYANKQAFVKMGDVTLIR